MTNITLDPSLINYWKTHHNSEDYEKEWHCKHCHKLMINLSELENVYYHPTRQQFFIRGQHVKYKSGEAVKEYVESLQNRFLVKGRNLSGKVFFRQLCWDCFHKELEETIIKLHKTREIKYTWVRKYMKGELPSYYPVPFQSACFYFKFLFGMTDKELKQECDKFVTASYDVFLRKYNGDEAVAKQKYDEYCQKQARNGCKLEYFVEKYGEEEGTRKYKEVCRAKAITKQNSIEKYGREFGIKLFKEYCKKQAVAGCTIDYFIDKYGEEAGKKKYDEVCHQKALVLSNFIRKYGEEEGKIKYEQWIGTAKTGFSLGSQKLFEQIDETLGDKAIESKWFTKNGEAEIEIVVKNSSGDDRHRFAKPDYMLGNKIIEFNGDYWHMNPKFYSPDSTRKIIFGCEDTITAQEIWDNDRKRKEALERLGYTVFVVWEDEYASAPEQVVKDCCNFLNT